MPKISRISAVPTIKTAEAIDQTAVQNTWYSVADLNNIEVMQIVFSMETADETIEIRVVADEIDVTGTQAPATAGIRYWVYFNQIAEGTTILSTATGLTTLSGSVSGITPVQHLQVLIRKTTAAGANKLRCAVLYSQW